MESPQVMTGRLVQLVHDCPGQSECYVKHFHIQNNLKLYLISFVEHWKMFFHTCIRWLTRRFLRGSTNTAQHQEAVRKEVLRAQRVLNNPKKLLRLENPETRCVKISMCLFYSLKFAGCAWIDAALLNFLVNVFIEKRRCTSFSMVRQDTNTLIYTHPNWKQYKTHSPQTTLTLPTWRINHSLWFCHVIISVVDEDEYTWLNLVALVI